MRRALRRRHLVAPVFPGGYGAKLAEEVPGAAGEVEVGRAPILGDVPGVPGFYNAVTSNGYTLAPISARLVTDLIVHGRTDLDLAPFRIDRFL